jgi:C-terminal processing protease CtpA/Prc
MKTLHIFTLTLLLACCVSCQNTWMDDLPAPENAAIFDAMWSEIDENYVFFDQKNVNWEQVKTTYSSQLSEEMTEAAFFEVLSGALSELQDGHVSLYAGFNTWNYYDLYLPYATNFDKTFIEQNYLSRVNTIGPFVYDILAGNIGYLYYSSFGDNFTDEQLTWLVDYFSATEGLIIDVRGNLGGAGDNVTQLMSIFVQEAQVMGKMVNPATAVSEDDIQVKPNGSAPAYDKDVVVLTNRQCYSSCNIFAGFMSQLPQVTLLGDTTGGGTGLAVGSDLANGWRFRYSAAKVTLADGSEFEAGVAPDLYVTTGPEEQLQGKDALIEEALELLSK